MSTIYLYGDKIVKRGLNRIFPFHENENFILDGLDLNYLSSFLLKTINDFQYVKNKYELSIKIILNQEYLDSGLNETKLINERFRYCVIQNEGEQAYLYFIVSCEWISKECVKLNLRMDVLNQTLSGFGAKITFDKKTLVERCHQDRFIQLSDKRPNETILYRKIPQEAEGINPVLMKKESTNINLDVGYLLNTSWYLIYRAEAETTGAPLDCYLSNDKAISISGLIEYNFNNETLKEILGNNKIMMLDNYSIGGNSSGGYATIYYVKDGNKYSVELNTIENLYNYFLVYIIDNEIVLAKGKDSPVYIETISGITSITFSNDFEFGYYARFLPNLLNQNRKEYVEYVRKYNNGKYYFSSLNTTKPFNEIDRSDKKILKIICLPYCPIEYEIGSKGELIFSGNVELSNDMIRIKDINEDFNLNKQQYKNNPFKALEFESADFDLSTSALRIMNNDSKLFNSEFYQFKFYYDNFSYTFKLENAINDLNINSWNAFKDSGWRIIYKVSNGLRSSFLFYFPNPFDDVDLTYLNSYTIDDYDRLIYVNRSNEVALFTNSFLDYIRTGYNFDVKNKNLSLAKGIVGGIQSTILGGAKYGKYGAIAGGATALLGGIFSQIEAQNKIEQNLKSSAYSGASVENADDLNLLKFYSGNKLRCSVFEPTENMKKLLDDLFYYTGWIRNVQEVPNVSSRVHFNYLKCKAVFFLEYSYNNDIIEAVKDKLNEGVTFFHKVDNAYDVSQIRENWETWMIESSEEGE